MQLSNNSHTISSRYYIHHRYIIGTVYIQYASQYITVRHSTSQYVTVRHSTSQYVTVRHSTSQYITVRHSTSQYVTVRHSTSQYVTVYITKPIDQLTLLVFLQCLSIGLVSTELFMTSLHQPQRYAVWLQHCAFDT